MDFDFRSLGTDGLYGDGPVRGIYRVRKAAKSEGVNLAVVWSLIV